MNNYNRCIIVFTRHPELGVGKRRLAKTVGDEKALAIYKVLLQRTCGTVRSVIARKHVWYAADFPQVDIWSEVTENRYLQVDGDLGERMRYAFAKALKDHSQVIIIGTDLYELDEVLLNEAFEKLESHDVVIGPAYDGGYYLIGFNGKIPKNVFSNKAWSTSSVYEDTMQDLTGLSVFELPKLNDIDTEEDAMQVPELKNIIIENAY